MDYPRPWVAVYEKGGVPYDIPFEKISLPELLARTRQWANDLKRGLEDWELVRLYEQVRAERARAAVS